MSETSVHSRRPAQRERVSAARADAYPLAPMQEAMLLRAARAPRDGLYVQQFVCTLPEALHVPSLRRAWQHLADRHPVLRTSFELDASPEPLQRVHPRAELPWTEHDWRGLGGEEREEAMRAFLAEDRRAGFDPARAPLARVALVRLEDELFRLVWSSHHALLDGYARRILLREVFEEYEALAAGRSWEAPAPGASFAEYVEWLGGDDEGAARAFWEEALRGFDTPNELSLERGGGEGREWHRFQLPEGLTDGLGSLAQSREVTLNTILQVAWALLLARYTGDRDVAFGATRACRRGGLPGAEGVVGMLSNTVPVRISVDEGRTVADHLEAARSLWLAMRPHERTHLARIQEWSGVPAGTPMFETLLGFETETTAQVLARLGGGWERRAFELHQWTSYPLVVIAHGGPRVAFQVTYAPERFGRAAVLRIERHLTAILAAFAADPDQPLGRVEMLDGAEARALLAASDRTAEAAAGQLCIHELWEAQAARTPGAAAVRFRGEAMSYAELDARANRLAHRLRALGAGPDVPVGVLLERTPDALAAMLAVLKAGGAYLTLDPAYPAERLVYLLEDAGIRLVVSRGELAGRIPRDGGMRVLRLDADAAEIAREPADAPGVRVDPDGLAYVIYTSGSTGRPKGVMLRHRGAGVLLHWLRDEMPAEERELVLGSTSFGFDVSVAELWGTLCWGGTLLLVENALELARVREPVRTAAMVPTAAAELVRTGGIPPSVRALNLGGEPVSPDLARELFATGTVTTVRNLYGPTEDTVYSTWSALRPGDARVTIGGVVPGSRAYVLDGELRPVPVEVPGELYLAGEGLARGYLGRPGPTAASFLPDPFARVPGERMYRTRDRVRWTESGEIEYSGRADQQVKVRGFRIEPGEIEAVLREHPSVADAVAVVREDAPGDRRLVAYLIPAAGPADAAELRAHLRGRLPEYMVPSALVELDAFPRTGSGKIDRRALPAPADAGGGDFLAPRTATEEALAAIFADVLRVERVGARDGFFELGGHSLLATRLVARARERLGVELPVHAPFDASTVEELARVVDALRAGAHGAALPILPVPRDGSRRLPLSFAQERLWFVHRMDPRSAAYNVPLFFRLEGELDAEALRRAFETVVARHETLRTVFRGDAAGPVQLVLPPEPFPLPVARLDAGPDAEARALRMAEDEARRPFDLAAGPLLRALLVRLAPRSHLLLATMHHVAGDGWSTAILTRELRACYSAFARGAEPELPGLPVQYADYAAWEREALSPERLEPALDYWRAHLAGAGHQDLPADRVRRGGAPARGERIRAALPAPLVAAARGFAREAGATTFMVLLAAFKALLSRHGGREDVVVGTPVAGRDRAETEGLIGFFVNTLALRTGVAGGEGFRALLARVRETTLAGYAHQHAPFERVVAELQADREGGAPLFGVMFAYNSAAGGALALPGLEVSRLPVERGAAKFDLMLSLEDGPDGISGAWELDAELFDRRTVERLAGRFVRLLEAGLAAPDAPVGDLPLLGADEAAALLAASSGPAAPVPAGTFHEAFAARAALAPDAPAVVFPGETLSFGELDRRANQLARALRRRGIGPEARVGLCMERGTEAVLGILGILKAGAAYVPLDPAHPLDRIAAVVEACAVPVVLAQARTADRVPAGTGTIRLDADRAALEAESGEPVESGAIPENAAYVIHTSGSTGAGKGVVVQHGSLLNLGEALRRGVYGGRGPLRVSVNGPFTFDTSVKQLVQLLAGSSLHVVPEEVRYDGRALAAWLRAERVQVLDCTPAQLRLLLADGLPAEAGPDLADVLVAGEAVDEPTWERLAGIPGIRFHNLYGPTECTVDATACVVGDFPEAPTIGRPLPNVRTYALDGRLNPVPTGVPGELYVGGEGVARGYLGRPETTAESYLPDPFGPAGSRMYRTGDRVRQGADGALEFLGRADNQVKIRGFRIEPGEIESVLWRHPGVRQAAVVAREAAPGDHRLVAYVAGADGGAPSARELREHLAASLPAYMVPAAFVALEEFPLSRHGKTDRRALPEPDWGAGAEAYVAPRSPTEEQVAAIWAAVLGLERVGAEDDFFALGGHSLLVARVAARLRDALGAEVPLRVLFDAPTVAGVADWIEAAWRDAPDAGAPPLRRLPRDGSESLPLSFAQRRLWFVQRMEPESAAYNMPFALRLRGPLDVPALRGALAGLARRHETLRTRFVAAGDEPEQVVDAPRGVALPVVDVGARPAEADRLAAAEAARPFDLAAGPVLRALLLRLAEGEHRLVLVLHHVAGDGWSTGVLFRELGALYGALARGEASPLPELPVQYADYAAWQRERLAGDAAARELAFWREKLRDAPALLELPADRPRPAAPGDAGATRTAALSRALTEGLRGLSRREGTTLFVTLLAGWQALLGRWAGQDDVVVGAPFSSRPRTELEELIGFFVNTLPLRADLAGSPTAGELLRRVRETVLEAQTHQDVPFERLVEELQPGRSARHSPLFQVLFALQAADDAAPCFEGVEAERLPAGTGTAKYDLALVVEERGDALSASLTFRVELFDAATAGRMLAGYVRVLEAMAADPHRVVGDVDLLDADERRRLRAAARAPRGIPSDRCVHELFAEQAERVPAKTALVSGGERVSYAELHRRSDGVARLLAARGVGPDVRVGVCMERSPEMVAAILGVLKAGGAYVPLDPAYPADRVAFMLADARVPVLLTQERLRGGLPAFAGETVCLDAAAGLPAGGPARPAPAVTPEHLFYVIYTSGSTGTPKGTEVPHRAVPGFFMGTDYVRWDEEQVLLQHSSVSWDVFTLEMWPALLTGGTCVLFPGQTSEPRELGEQVRAHGVTTLWLTSAYFNLIVDTCPETLAGVRQVMVGGEGVSVPHVRRALELFPGLRLVNGYGPSECTVFASCWPIPRDFDAPAVPIGAPIGDRRVYLLDRRFNPVPTGVPGELCVGGPAVARGYLDRPELTADRFVPDPFSPEPGARLYRSGDRVRMRADGLLDFVGRTDFQVKVRGFRVEPGEVEAVLAGHPGVREAVVAVRRAPSGEPRLVGYVTAREAAQPAPAELRAWLRERLPDYMVPGALVVLDAMPLTAHGKADRRALPDPEESPVEGGHAAPRTPVEEVVAGIWAEVLGRSRVGVHDDFFELGGHSLLATRVLSRVRRAFGVEVPLRALFDAPTVAGTAERVEAALRGGAGEPALPLLRVPRGDTERLPLSFAQQRLWFIDRLEPGVSTYNIPGALRLRGPLHAAALRRALGEIVRRHETLRTVFRETDGGPVQVVTPHAGFALEVADLSGVAPAGREAEALRRARAEAELPFDLEAGPPFRARLLRLDDGHHVLLLTMHHVAADGWSRGVLHRELEALYGAFARGEASPLEELPVQYADFAVWQRRWLAGETLDRQAAWWRGRLAGAPATLELPTDRARPAVRGRGGAAVEAVLPPELADALRALSRREGATLFMTVLAGWQALLARWSGQTDVVVGTPIAGRTHPDTEGLIGFFANTLALRADLGGDPTFAALLGRVREGALGAYAHQDLPFERLVEEVAPGRSLSHTPLFQVVLALQSAPSTPPRLDGVETAPLRLGTGTAKFDLTLALAEGGAGLAGSLEYSTELFDASTAQRMLGHLRVLLEGATAAPERPLSGVEMLDAAERDQVVRRFGAPAAASRADATLHGLFAAQAARTPGRAAVSFGGEALTYAELDGRSNRLARWLRAHGVGPEVPVGLCLERSPETVVAVLGVLKAGGAYVPLDPDYPAERLAYAVRDSGVRVVLTRESVRGRLPADAEGARTVALDAEWERIAREDDAPLPETVGPGGLAYVIYTSGSTGRPKGVQVTHANVVRLFTATEPWFGFGERDVWTLFHSYAFDFSVWEIWGALLYGGRLVVVPWATSRSPEAFRELLVREGVTVLNQTPSAFRQLIAEDEAAPPEELALRWVVFGGEALEPGSLRPWTARRGVERPRLVNMYGITETTVHVTFRPITAEDVERGSASPIGRAIPDLGVYVLDPHGNPVPVGVPGEMYVAGAGVARGYLGRPELTAGRFVPDPFTGGAGARLYRSGDLARWLPTGELEYLGRMDEQVKVRGFRIEPGEIEAALAKHPAVREAVVVVREDVPGDRRLVAYLVAGGEPPSQRELRDHLGGHLPEYMVPAAFVALERIPLTGNGKTDRRALPAPDAAAAPERYTAPRTPLEARLAAMWAEVLGTGRVGVDDDFFALGGHSLLAVRLVSRIRRETGVRVPLGALFAGGTVERLAALVAGEGGEEAGGPLVPLRAAGALRPFFCVHAVDGHVLSYAALAERLGPGRPFWGLQAPGVDGGEPLASVGEMADLYTRAIRGAQPHGPYLLGGWSMGAAVALEAARRLRAAGEEVGALVLLDPPVVVRRPEECDGAAFMEDTLREMLGGRLPAGHDEDAFRALDAEGQLALLQAEAVAAGALPADLDPGRLGDLLRVRRANLFALRSWRPEPYAGGALLLEAEERPVSGPRGDRPIDWRWLCAGGLEVLPAPGDHFTLLREPHVRVAAGRVARYLDRAEGAPRE